MSRRWKMLSIAGLFMLVILLYSANFSRHREPVHLQDFKRIQVGMTREEVEAIFGKPPGVYSYMHVSVSGKSGPQAHLVEENKWQERWTFNDGSAFVIYDKKDGKVESGEWYDHSYYQSRSLLQELLDIIRGRQRDRKQSPW